ncbi:glycoside hydrolase domain-containing protein [Listeria fleischmannii]|uniref:Rv2525c-like glycoside hydrolase-like domain-containing protein n=1 Tax=Listeria fleischmannii FSL S10-1203 TaxID=1265822 RepID=W7DGP9_9LIST|nr:glycoside hydrolase domain-containing protein [Listeria fleischmannii]EUJ48972.1 hypothetical protein MCOL2_16407 [Listeria fleischmannii FSL S10-1203]
MAVDEQLLAVQQWLNETYGKVPGYYTVEEDGKHTWRTVYALTTALQHELGIEELSTSFGPTTTRLFDEQGGITPGDTSNKVKILMGAFWSKGAGFNPLGFGTYFGIDLEGCVRLFKGAVGIDKQSAHVDAKLMKALLNMDAYTLLGDSRTRSIQQALNRNYGDYFDYIACDGNYQRNTSKGLIFALQAELGLGVGTANGAFGPLTTSSYEAAAANQGITHHPGVVKIVQYALYIQTKIGFPYDGTLNAGTVKAIQTFEAFMAIQSSQSGYPTITIVKGLMQSSGDPDRACAGVDTSRQLTADMVKTLQNNGYTYVGRYLTGTVGGTTPKFLTTDEMDRLTGAGLKIFPIYQDNSPKVSYYTENQGLADAQTACARAFELGFEPNTILYYAVDVDTTENDIATNILPYFKGVVAGTVKWQNEHFRYPFQVGIYASRNACTQVKEAGYSVGSFVANMSTGYSGNLGFGQPKDWTFDQFAEPTGGVGVGSGHVPIDKVAVSGRDKASHQFRLAENQGLRKMTEWGGALFGQAVTNYVDFSLGQTYVLYDELAYKMSLSVDTKTSGGSTEISGRITGGKIETEVNQKVLNLIGSDADISADFTNGISKITGSITEGSIQISATLSEEGTLSISAEITDEQVDVLGTSPLQLVYTLEFEFRNRFPDGDLMEYAKLTNEDMAYAGLAIVTCIVAGYFSITLGALDLLLSGAIKAATA